MRDDNSTQAESILSSYIAHLHAQNITLPPSTLDLLKSYLTASYTAASNNSSSSPCTEAVLPTPNLPLHSLLTTSIPRSFHVGTGLSSTHLLSPLLLSAQSELLFATCFWAPSASLTSLSSTLSGLSALNRGIRVRIGLSSVSLTQKLFHTTSPLGYTYPPSSWASSLGLPPPQELTGVDLSVKSLFFWPFSVLHSKFVVVDRRIVVVLSSNVSWETWMEQAVILEGDVVARFVDFFVDIWTPDESSPPPPPTSLPPPPLPTASPETFVFPPRTLPTLFLPHPHHRNPHLPLPLPLPSGCLPAPSPPPSTPQNLFLASLLSYAHTSIYVHTPNLTSEPFLSLLLSALARGVRIDLVTCRRMMVIEQLLTTGLRSVTELCVWRFVRRARASGVGGRLGVWYYTGSDAAEATGARAATQAVQSHVKALVVDDAVAVLGSANADRASWWTSQEVNVAVLDKSFAQDVRKALVGALGDSVEAYWMGEGVEGLGVGVGGEV